MYPVAYLDFNVRQCVKFFVSSCIHVDVSVCESMQDVSLVKYAAKCNCLTKAFMLFLFILFTAHGTQFLRSEIIKYGNYV